MGTPAGGAAGELAAVAGALTGVAVSDSSGEPAGIGVPDVAGAPATVDTGEPEAAAAPTTTVATTASAGSAPSVAGTERPGPTAVQDVAFIGTGPAVGTVDGTPDAGVVAPSRAPRQL